MSEKITKIDLEEFLIVNYSREYVVDIRRECVQFNLYEDLMSPVLTFTATLNDSNGLIERFPFIGEEIIGISFKNEDETSKKITRLFNVYKVSNRQSNKERNETFTLHGISFEARVNMATSVDRAYTGLRFSDIVGSVYDEYFLNSKLRHGLRLENRYIAQQKSIYIEETYGSHSVVSPGSDPISFINYCARQAQSSAYVESDYIFYEDVEGFNFRTVSSLIDSEPVQDYYLANPSASNRGNIQPFQIINELEYGDNEFDAIKSQKTGLYDNSVEILDPVLKRYVEKNFNYHFRKSWDNIFKGLGEHSFTSEYSAERAFDGSSHSRFIIGNYSEGEYRDTSYINGRTVDRFGNILDPVSHYPFVRHKFLNERISKQSQMNTKIIMKATIPGDVNRKVGDVIRIYIPQRSGEEEYKQRYNIFYGEKDPRFLVTALRHSYSFADDSFITVMEVTKDSLGQQLVQTKASKEVEKRPNYSLL